jgi:hypothetical protein
VKRKYEETVTDAEIKRVFLSTNYGNRPHRGIVNSGVVNVLVGWQLGSTLTRILVELSLARLRKGKQGSIVLSPKGRKYLTEVLKYSNITWETEHAKQISDKIV